MSRGLQKKRIITSRSESSKHDLRFPEELLVIFWDIIHRKQVLIQVTKEDKNYLITLSTRKIKENLRLWISRENKSSFNSQYSASLTFIVIS